MNAWPESPFTAAHLAARGITDRQLRDAVADGAVRRVLFGVYADAALPDTTELRARAAMLVLPPHVVLSDHSAAWIHGVDAFDPSSRDLPPDLEVVSVDGNDRTRRSGVLGGKRSLEDDDLTVIGGVRLTTAVRTACDLACLRGRYAALAVLDAFMRLYGLTTWDYQREAAKFVGRRGVRQLRELLLLASELAESVGESWTRMAIHDSGLPPPTPQVWVWLEGFGRVRLDLAYRVLKIVVEYDGEEFHSSDEQKGYDAARRKALRDAGWIVIVLAKGDFAGPALDRWLHELRAAIDERSPRAGRRYARAVTDERRRGRRTTA